MIEHIINQTLQKNIHSKEDWNNCLRKFNDENIFQSYEWGELKELEGWEVLRITVNDNETLAPILIAQVLIRKVIGIKIAWCPGGPLIQTDNIKEGQDAIEKLEDVIFNQKVSNLRCKPNMLNTNDNKELFNSLIKPNYSLTSPKTTILEIVSEENFLEQVKKKHRYYIKQSQKNEISWQVHSESKAEETFLAVYEDMKKSKNLKLPIIDIKNFAKLLGFTKNGQPRVFSFVGIENSKTIAVCLISIINKKAFYHYAASTERGRELSASYGMIFHLINKLRELGIKKLDFGGLSPDGSSTGVDFFKLGFNGEVINKVGEFDITKSKLHSYFFSKILKFKNKQ